MTTINVENLPEKIRIVSNQFVVKRLYLPITFLLSCPTCGEPILHSMDREKAGFPTYYEGEGDVNTEMWCESCDTYKYLSYDITLVAEINNVKVRGEDDTN